MGIAYFLYMGNISFHLSSKMFFDPIGDELKALLFFGGTRILDEVFFPTPFF